MQKLMTQLETLEMTQAKHTQLLTVSWDNGNTSSDFEYQENDAWATVSDLIKAPNCFSVSVFKDGKRIFHFEDGKVIEGQIPDLGASL